MVRVSKKEGERNTELDRNEAADHFIRRIIREVYDTVSVDIVESLETGLPKDSYQERSDWYLSLHESQRKHLEAITKDAVYSVIFRVFSVLDGVSGVEFYGEKPANYTLFFDTFLSEEAYDNENYEDRVQINPIHQQDNFLHDIFQEIMEEPDTES